MRFQQITLADQVAGAFTANLALPHHAKYRAALCHKCGELQFACKREFPLTFFC